MRIIVRAGANLIRAEQGLDSYEYLRPRRTGVDFIVDATVLTDMQSGDTVYEFARHGCRWTVSSEHVQPSPMSMIERISDWVYKKMVKL